MESESSGELNFFEPKQHISVTQGMISNFLNLRATGVPQGWILVDDYRPQPRNAGGPSGVRRSVQLE
jgi:hypothetical protein